MEPFHCLSTLSARTKIEVYKACSMPLPLVERSRKEIQDVLKETIEEVPNVKGCRLVSVRMTGKRLEISAHVLLDSTLSFEDVHRIVSSIEKAIRSKCQGYARITIQTEPVGHPRTGIAALAAEISDKVPGSRGVSNVHVQKVAGKWCVDLRVEVSANMSVKEADEIAKEVETKIKMSDPNISEVTVHIESASDVLSRELEGRGSELRWYIEHVAERFPEIKFLHGIKIRRSGDTVNVVLRCGFASGMSVKYAHDICRKLESTVRSAYPIVGRLEIREEPT